jgi:sporulation integral membrane protein YtvI
VIKTEEKKNLLINILFFFTIAVLAFLSFKLLPLFFPFLIGFSISVVLKPVSIFISEKTSVSYKIISKIIVGLFYLLLAFGFFLLGERIIKEASDLIKQLPSFYSEVLSPLIEKIINSIADSFAPFIDKEVILGNLSDTLGSFSVKLTDFTASVLTAFLKALPSFMISVVFAVISSFFFLSDYYKITSFLSRLLPKRFRGLLFQGKRICGKTIKNMIKGYLAILTITFIELFLGLTLLRVQNALVLSLIVAVLDIFPIIGSGTFLIPFSIFAFIYKRTALGVGVIILFLIITVVRNIIEPKIIGKRIGLHPIVMLLSVYIGGKIGGFLGILVLPLAITILKEGLTLKKQS